MNINSKITMSIHKFFKKHGMKILIIFIVWLIIFIINQYLKTQPKPSMSTNTYTPDEAIMDENGDVPNRYRPEINDAIKKYFDYCKGEQYAYAFNMLTDECQEFLYDNSISKFSEYIRERIGRDKTYYLQNYSNTNNVYIYDFYVTDNLEVTGGTGGYNETKEKIALKKVNGEWRISNQGYIGKEELNTTEEDENMKIKIKTKNISYQKESYDISVTNKTDKYILISDGTYTDSVTLNLGDQKRNATNTPSTTFLVSPNSTKVLTFVFDKFADDGRNPTEINFNNVRIYDVYDTKLKPENAEKLYSFNIKIKK
ncbi:MAG: hypothetical protein IKG14_00880 [Clostridia bacterium]|nr:hypothetical protein [Clostridia bacterium]MBR3324590.1 hypothetical protein [Clostridia bacterium]